MWARLADERGTTQVEYGLITVLSSIVAIVLLLAIGFDVIELVDAVEDLTGLGGEDGGEIPDPPRDDDV